MNNLYYVRNLNITALKTQLRPVTNSKEEGLDIYLVTEHILKTHTIINKP
jgi:hypothetical protein